MILKDKLHEHIRRNARIDVNNGVAIIKFQCYFRSGREPVAIYIDQIVEEIMKAHELVNKIRSVKYDKNYGGKK